MKILGLQAENIKKLVAVDIAPEGNLIKISGNNGAGKSSLLDSIYWACAGTDAIQEKPIRNGENKAFIKLSLGEDQVQYIVERKFTKKEDGEETSQLIISSPEGAKFPSPQTMLDKLIGAITFDPLEFANMEAKKQYEAIRVLSGVTYDFSKAENENKLDYNERTFINREIKTLEAQILSIAIDDNISNEKIDISEIFKELNKIKEDKIAYQRLLEGLASYEQDLSIVENQIVEFEEKIVNLRNRKQQIISNITTGRNLLENSNLKDDNYLKELEEKINSASVTNSLIETKHNLITEKARKQELLNEKNKKAQELTEKIEFRKQQGQKAIEEAKLPIEGLELRDGEVWINGIPFSQCSSAEQLKISTAIAMASNPKLRVIRIKEGALLDENNLKIIEDMAKSNDFQIWVELVGQKEMSIVIENGKILTKPETN